MKKQQLTLIIAASVILAWIFTIFPGKFLAAKISTWPVLNRLKILSPGAPIVINNRETVRISDGSDILEAVNSAKSKISVVAAVNKGNIVNLFSAVNLTSDGSFVTSAQNFSENTLSDYVVILGDGRQASITHKVLDPATSLIFFKAAINNVPVAKLGASKDLSAGDKVVFIQNSLQNFTAKALIAYVNFSQNDISGQTLLSDYPKRSFGVSVNSSLIPGAALINTSGDLVGIWNGKEIISTDVLKPALALYFADQRQIIRPSFGFNYSFISQNESTITSLPQGAFVKNVLAGSSSQKAGLLENDVITTVDSQTITESLPLEEILEKYKPGDKINLTLFRKGQGLTLSLTVGELSQ